MSAGKVFQPASPWHPSHALKGFLAFHRFGPSGALRCAACGARQWVETREHSPACGGSIEYDSKAAKPCKTLA